MYDIKWRFVSSRDCIKIGKGVVLSSLAIIAATYLVNTGRLPRSTFFIDAAVITLLLAGSRLFRRILFEYSSHQTLNETSRLAVIYGTTKEGRALAARFLSDSALGFKLLGFIDDDQLEVGRTINGVKVLGIREDLPQLFEHYPIKELIIAKENIAGDTLRELVQVSKKFGLRPRLITDFSHNQGSLREGELFRDIELGDLVGRGKKIIDLAPARRALEGKCVLITGAGGSIGSELARQIRGLNPRQLLLLDHCEYSLYQVDQELRVRGGDAKLILPLLLDLKDFPSLSRVIAEHRPDVIFHAAAYKHVPLVEANPLPSILNNIVGTYNLLRACATHEIDSFVLISSDKAVHPVGIMGATKRVCELLVNQYGKLLKRRYCSVRFGNVLGSRGSLIPLLKKQIQNGEPLTITHQDMSRYFMSLSEAISLILQALTLAAPGEILILRMGDPIKIIDLAKGLVTLMGKRESDVPILFTGMRPGEKMNEELYLIGNERQTDNPDILVLPEGDSNRVVGEKEQREFIFEVENIIQCAREGQRELAISSLWRLLEQDATPERLERVAHQ